MITSWLLLLLLLAMGISIWPVGRWGTGGGSAAAMGFWISLTTGLASALVLAGRGLPPAWMGLLVPGLLMGFAYAVGFCLLIMHALKIGPAGPTVTINNVALVAGVLYNWFWLRPQRPTAALLAGIIGVCGALLLIGLNRSGVRGDGRAMSRRWALLVIPGGLLSALSFMMQTYAGIRHPGAESGLVFATIVFLFSAVILLPVVLREERKTWSWRPVMAGVVIGVVNATGTPIGMTIMGSVGPEVFFPVTVAMPIIVMLIVGHFFYAERLDRRTTAGCVLAAASVALLAYASARSGPAL
jgi:drug/metabolite transporter (DMT)-like permease